MTNTIIMDIWAVSYEADGEDIFVGYVSAPDREAAVGRYAVNGRSGVEYDAVRAITPDDITFGGALVESLA